MICSCPIFHILGGHHIYVCKVSVQIFCPHFLLALSYFWVVCVLYISWWRSYSRYMHCRFCLWSMTCFSSFLAVSLEVQEFFTLIKLNLYILWIGLWSIYVLASLPQILKILFSSRSFIWLDFALGLWFTLNLLLYTVWVGVKAKFFSEYPGDPALSMGNIALSWTSYLGTFMKNQLPLWVGPFLNSFSHSVGLFVYLHPKATLPWLCIF